jgi:hypothetical protein
MAAKLGDHMGTSKIRYAVTILVFAALLVSLPAVGKAETLKWATRSGKVTGYKVNWGKSKNKPTHSLDVGKKRHINLNKLPLAEGVTYFLSVSAYNAAGESPPCAPVVYSPGDNNPPAPPGGLKAH